LTIAGFASILHLMKHIQLTPKVALFLDQKEDRESTKIELWYSHGGSWFESLGDRGRRHLLEHCLVARTSTLSDLEFKEYCFEYGIQYNAYTSPSVINLNGKSHKEDAKRMITLFAELFFAPTWDQEILSKETEIVLREIADRQGDTEYQLWQEIAAKTFTEDSIERHEVLGDETCVKTTTLEDCKRMYQQMVDESMLFITVSGGGINEAEIIDILAPYLSQLNITHKPLPHVFPNTMSVSHFVPITHSLAHKEASISLTIPCSVTWIDRPFRSLFSELFLGWNGSGLYDYLRDELELIYGYNFSFDEPGQSLRIDLNCEVVHVTKILDAVHTYFSDFTLRFNQHKFSLIKMNASKKFLQARDGLGFDSNFVINNILSYNTEETSEEYITRLKLVTDLSLQDFFEGIYKEWKNSTAVVTSREEGVTTLTYDFE
jgi:predicted Zn-dependent peptidase